ncbi:MAG TPA: hypothetical protein PLF98_11945, partial [Thermotogota bacterium]|nr:hypothetical protein [Thermotogota bacterium]
PKGGSALKRLQTIFFFLILFVVMAYGCSSFSSNGERMIRGMNFDFSGNLPLTFRVSSQPNGKTLIAYFLYQNVDCYFLGVNQRGHFCTFQMVPNRYASRTQGKTDLSLFSFWEDALKNLPDYSEFEEILSTRRLKCEAGWSLHSLMADAFGNTYILEAGEKDNLITRQEQSAIALTNFYLYEYLQIPPRKIGSGFERYNSILKKISEIGEIANIDDAFDVLETALQTGEVRSELIAVFNASEPVLYIALDADLSKIWKVDFLNETVCDYRGFESPFFLDFSRTHQFSEKELSPLFEKK